MLKATDAWLVDVQRVYAMANGPTWRRLLECARTPGVHALACYRFGFWLRSRSILLRLCLEPLYLLWFRHIRTSWGVEIGRDAVIGPGCYIGHFGGIIVSGRARIGARVNLAQGVTIGDYQGCPTIGDDVYVGPGAKLYGPITVGRNARIGPNTVVWRNVEENAVVAPADFVVLSRRGHVRTFTGGQS